MARSYPDYPSGYKVSFPFFDQYFISAPDNELLVCWRVFKPGLDNLFFIALLQPPAATMSLALARASALDSAPLGNV